MNGVNETNKSNEMITADKIEAVIDRKSVV